MKLRLFVLLFLTVILAIACQKEFIPIESCSFVPTGPIEPTNLAINQQNKYVVYVGHVSSENPVVATKEPTGDTLLFSIVDRFNFIDEIWFEVEETLSPNSSGINIPEFLEILEHAHLLRIDPFNQFSTVNSMVLKPFSGFQGDEFVRQSILIPNLQPNEQPNGNFDFHKGIELPLEGVSNCEATIENWYHTDTLSKKGFATNLEIEGSFYDSLNVISEDWIADSLEIGVFWNPEFGLVRHYTYDVSKQEAVILELIIDE